MNDELSIIQNRLHNVLCSGEVKMKTKSLKRALIKEEFVTLTGNGERAIILNQFDYWAHRTYDIDEYLEQEIARHDNPEAINLLEKTKTNGWIYKSAKEMLTEIMLPLSEKTARRHLVYLVEHGWLQERDSPDNKWDKTKQYRYNVIKVQKDLLALNLPLEGWKTITERNVASKGQGVASKGQDVASKRHDVASEIPFQSVPTLGELPIETPSEITTEITTDIINETPNFSENNDDDYKKEEFQQSDSSLLTGPVEINDEYFNKIEEKLSLLGIRQILSSVESKKIAEMKKNNIPLKLILNTIDEVVRNAKGKHIKSFNYFADAIWEAFKAMSPEQDKERGYDATTRLIERLR